MTNPADKLSLLMATPKEEPVSYFKGVVQQTQGSKAYVLIDGGVSLWCDAMDVKALADDRVRVEVRKRKATLIANYSHPMTDDALANDAYGLAQVANNAASDAQVAADDAIEDAGLARQAAEQAASDASSAAQSASEAATSAANAQTSASNAQASAQTAAQSATQAVADAGRAATAAENAEGSAAEASAQATAAAGSASDAASSAATAAGEAERANQMANGALAGLSTLESVIDTVDWFAQHKKASTDTTVNPDKDYYTFDASTGTLSKVEPDGTENPSQQGWYELDEAISNYVASHTAMTNDGLYVVGLSNGWRVLVSTGAGDYTAGIFLIDPNGVIAQATTATGTTFDSGRPYYIGDEDAYIVFDGNGGITIGGDGVSISGGVTIGGYDKTLSEVMAALNASISKVEYGVGSSPTSHSDITSWSSASPAWEHGKYVWMRTTTNGLTYTHTCIQGAKGEDGDEGSQILGITTAPSSYTTTTGGFKPTYRIALSTVKTQSGASEVRVGDVLAYSYYHYPVGYVDASYVYCGERKSIRGAPGSGVTVSKTEYGTSASASTQPSSWSQTVPESISQGTWLWVKTTYSDGSDATTKSYVGTDGDDGKSVYVKSADKTGDTTTVVLTDGTNDTTLTITDGTDGKNGTPGTNGLSGYVHTAWANSADGATDFSTTVSTNKTYLGVYTDNTQADSTDPTKYSWSLIKGQKGDTGPQGPTGKGVSSITEYYALNNDSANAPSDSSFSTGVKTPTESNKYVWNYELITYTDSSTSKTAKHIAATYGMTGSAGKGITSIVDYYAVNNSTTAPDDGSFSTAVVTPTASNRYLWNYELTTYTDSTTSKTGKRVIGVYGEKGNKGDTPSITATKSGGTTTIKVDGTTIATVDDGTDGTTPTVTTRTNQDGSTTIVINGSDSATIEKGTDGKSYYTYVRYSANSNGSDMVATPTTSTKYIGVYSGTSSTVPAYTAFTWSKYVGEDGTSPDPLRVTSTKTDYQLSTSGTTTPTGNWSETPLAPTTTQYLWTRTTLTFSDGSSSTSYSVGGKAGTSVTVTSTATTYAASTSGTTAPSSGWQNSVPSVAQGSYLWTKVVTTFSDGKTATSLTSSRQGKDGEPGQKGDTGPEAVVTVYPSAVDWGANTATLAVSLRVDGTITTPSSYKWTKGTSATSLGTAATLAVTDLNETYHCTVTW